MQRTFTNSQRWIASGVLATALDAVLFPRNPWWIVALPLETVAALYLLLFLSGIGIGMFFVVFGGPPKGGRA